MSKLERKCFDESCSRSYHRNCQMTQRGPYLIAASYDLTISVTDLATDASGVAANLKFGLQNAQANRIIPLNGSRFAVASNPYIFVYDRTAKTNKPIQTFQGHQANVTDLCTDGQNMFSSSEDKSWRRWDFTQPRPVNIYPTACCLNTIAIACNKEVIVTGNDRGQVEAWDIKDGKALTQLRVSQSSIRSIVVYNDNKAVVGCQDGNVVLITIDATAITEIKKIKCHDSFLTRVAVSANELLFATASADSTAKVFSIETGECKTTLADSNQSRWVWDVAFTDQDTKVCTGGTDKVCRIWNVENGALLRQIEWHQKGVTCIAVIQ